MAQLPKIVYGNGTQTAWEHGFLGGVARATVNNVTATFTDAAGVITMTSAPANGAAVRFFPTAAEGAADPHAESLDAAIINPPKAPRRRIASAQGGFWRTESALDSNGTVVSGTDRFSFVMNTDVVAPEVVYYNGRPSTGPVDLPNANAVTIRSVWEGASELFPVDYGAATASLISSGSGSGHVIGAGELVHSKPCPFAPLDAGSTQYLRTYKVVQAGEKWPLNWESRATATIVSGNIVSTTDGVYGGTVTDQSDATKALANSLGTVAATAYAWGPVAIIAEQITPVPVVLITGDSNAAGTNAKKIGEGYLGLACTNASVAFLNCGVFAVNADIIAKRGRVIPYLSRFADHVVIHALTNDMNGGAITTLDQAKAIVLSLAKQLGCATNRLWFCTVLPRTTSSDSWATATNQTLPAWEALRVAFNNWLRDKTGTGMRAYINARLGNGACVAGVIDPCTVVEVSATNTALILDSNGQQAVATFGRWITSGAANFYTGDGTHMNTPAQNLAAQTVPTGSFTLFDGT